MIECELAGMDRTQLEMKYQHLHYAERYCSKARTIARSPPISSAAVAPWKAISQLQEKLGRRKVKLEEETRGQGGTIMNEK